MFEQTFVQTQAQTRRPWTVVVSLSLQCGVVAILFLLPLLRLEKLRVPDPPKLHVIPAWIPPVPVIHEIVPRAAAVSAPRNPRILVYVQPDSHSPVARSVDIPTPLDSEGPAWSGSQGAPLGPMLMGSNMLPARAPVQPPSAPGNPKPVPAGPQRVGGDVQAAKLVFGPHPAYPTFARTTHSQGSVRLQAIIGANGGIRDLRVLSGPPLLIEAARDAVRQWRYQPTLLNGVAVEVVTEIEINFSLGQ